jgi:molybdopterin synthase catalytic subunit
MRSQIIITTEPINEAVLVAQREASTSVGAVVSFVGLVRGTENKSGQAVPISALEYECFQRMAEHQFALILQEVERKWPIESVRLVHRIGVVKINKASVFLEVLAPHRAEAFAALQFVIEEMKRAVPIWKRALP